MVLFYISFFAGVVAGFAGWRQFQQSSDTLSETSTSVFNPGISDTPVDYNYPAPPETPTWVAGQEPAPLFPDNGTVQEQVAEAIGAGAFTEQSAWTSYYADTSGSSTTWTQYVNQLATLGIDFSMFSAPPPGSQYNPGWQAGGGSGL
jgi:hypothetical protein